VCVTWCALALGLAGLTDTVTAAAITFTGDVVADFAASDASVLIVTDSAAALTFNDGPTGWDIVDVRYSYDSETDTAYFGKMTRKPEVVAHL
jgi:hypothetical protein